MTAIRLRPTSQHLVFSLPLFMGVIEYIVRVAFRLPGANEFFPASLVASGISLRWQSVDNLAQAIFIAYMGIFASLGGVLLWLYLLMASFNEDVRALLPLHPIVEASMYYALCVYLTGCKEKEVRCWTL